MRKSHVNGRLGATVSTGLASIGVGTGGGGGLTEVTGGARGVTLTKAFENAVMKLWPAYCHIDTQRRRVGEGIGERHGSTWGMTNSRHVFGNYCITVCI